MAGSTVTSRSRLANDPSAARRKSAFCPNMRSVWTLSREHANQSCQTRAMRSTSGWEERTMRSSHQRWSWP